jgi:hypothetical protein
MSNYEEMDSKKFMNINSIESIPDHQLDFQPSHIQPQSQISKKSQLSKSRPSSSAQAGH